MKKLDLHIHTISTGKDSDFTFDIDKMLLYVRTSKLDAIAITNHNVFNKDQFYDIKEKLNITVLPGIEVDIENAHMIVISDESNMDNFCEQCNQLNEKMVNDKRYISYDEFISIFSNYEQYLLIPHYKKKPTLQQQIIKKFGKNITCGEVDSVKKFCTFKLNVIIGKRSSGKTHTLENIKKSFDTSEIKYIKQFEITEKSGSEKFEEITKKGYEKITNDYINPIKDIIPNILEMELILHRVLLKIPLINIIKKISLNILSNLKKME